MTVEINKNEYLTTEEVIRREHSALSGSRKTTIGPSFFPKKSDAEVSVDAINVALTATADKLDLERQKAYRLVMSVSGHFTLSRGADTATTSDIYLPANTPIIISAGLLWDRVNVVKATGASDGIAQIVEVQ